MLKYIAAALVSAQQNMLKNIAAAIVSAQQKTKSWWVTTYPMPALIWMTSLAIIEKWLENKFKKEMQYLYL